MVIENQEMKVINERIEEAYRTFNNVPSHEHELIDCAIYTINALEAQRRFIINQYRKS